MKLHHIIYSALVAASLASCTDEIKFGSAFLEKAPGGDVTADTIFGNAEYTRRFLANCYSRQYYGLTYGTGTGFPNSASGWVGKFDAVTDLYQLYYSSTTVHSAFYKGQMNANTNGLMTYTSDQVWECVRSCLTFIENVDRVPGLSESEKQCMKAEVYCIMASRYFDLFQFFGGLPLVDSRFTGSESSYDLPRATAEETVEFILSLFQKAIDTPSLPWAYEGADADTETGHWTKAGAMGMKCRVLQFAASPLFNSDQPYCGGASEAEQKHLVWFGAYKPEYWQRLKTACKELVDAIAANGHYKLLEPKDINSAWTKPTDQQYRLAFRRAYIDEGSPELLHQVRVTMKDNSKYNWFYWAGNVKRNNYCPTQEYIEMFPWADGTPFSWDEAEAAYNAGGKRGLDDMYFTATLKNHAINKLTLTRDPRLYETAIINGVAASLGWADAKTSGQPFETWMYGANGSDNVDKESGRYSTGYFTMKFVLNPNTKGSGKGSGDMAALYLEWPTLRLSDIYLMYAEALLQADGDNAGCLTWINKVRARVGLGKLEDMDTRHDYRSDKAALLEELLNERAREFGLENQRYFDIVRYKRTDILEKPLHRLKMHRMKKNAAGEWEVYDMKWYGNDNKKEDFPTHYSYERVSVANPSRVWWSGCDPHWLLYPFPATEINKGYGLIQNPGW